MLAVIAFAITAAGCKSDKKATGAAPGTTTSLAVGSTKTTANQDTSTTAPANAALPDACTLVTKAEADALAGLTLQPASAVETTCTYTAPTSGPTAQVEVFVGDGAKNLYETDKTGLQHTFTAVPGVADECYEEDGAIFLQKAGTWVAIQRVSLDDPAASKVALENAAKAAAGRF